MKLKICVGTTCHLMGAPALIESLEGLEKEIRDKILFEYATCFSVCQGSITPPVVKIEDEYFGNMTPDLLNRIIKERVEKGE